MRFALFVLSRIELSMHLRWMVLQHCLEVSCTFATRVQPREEVEVAAEGGLLVGSLRRSMLSESASATVKDAEAR